MAIVNEELIKKVKDFFDLNIYEAKVWIATLSKGVCSAGEIAEFSGVPRSRTYDILESLEKKGFVIEKLGKPVKYMAIKPGIIIEKLKNNLKKETEEKIKTLDRVKETKEYEEILNIHNKGFEMLKSQDISTFIKGRSSLNSQVREIIEETEEFLYIAMDPLELKTKLKNFSELFAKLKKRGVDIKIIISSDDKDAKLLTKKLKVEVRSKKIKGRFLISDRKEILLMIKSLNDSTEDYGIWINSEFLANSLSRLFEIAWKN